MSTSEDGRYLPIIYLRGFTYGKGGTESTVDDPFYGFNTGSTHVRQNETGQPTFYVFESPVLRLLSDHGYRDSYIGGVRPGPEDAPVSLPTFPTQRLFHADPDAGIGRRSLWIYRYYDEASRTFPGTLGRRQEIEESALGLGDLIAHVKEQTGAPRVNLVAHSTGGLIIRCLIQRIYPDRKRSAVDHIDKVFTYAAPHGGIRFAVGGAGHRVAARPGR